MREQEFSEWLGARRWKGDPLSDKGITNRLSRMRRIERSLRELGFAADDVDALHDSGGWPDLLAKLRALIAEGERARPPKPLVPKAQNPEAQLRNLLAAARHYDSFRKDPGGGADPLEELRAAFYDHVPDFVDFEQRSGTYWEGERRYKDETLARIAELAATGTDAEAGRAIYHALIPPPQGLPLNWRTKDEVDEARPELADEFHRIIGRLARSDSPPEEAVPAAMAALADLRGHGLAALRHGEVLGIALSVYGSLHPDRAAWFKVRRMAEASTIFAGADIFRAGTPYAQIFADYREFMRDIFDRLQDWGWKPRDWFDAQGFLWVALDWKAPEEEDEEQEPARAAPAPDGDASYWFVGAMFGGRHDQLDRFRELGIWEIDTPSPSDRAKVLAMRPGEKIAVKAAFVQRDGLQFDNAGLHVSAMRIKATGTIAANPGDGERVSVDWDAAAPARDWYHYTYQRTIWQVRPTNEWARALIRFAFDGEPQDHDWFLRQPFWLARLATGQAEREAEPEAEPGIVRDPTNLILYGPPGTGKTWSTIGEAVRLCLGLSADDPLLTDPGQRPALRERYDELRKLGQIGFVTFHQNYGYEQFIEGLRPEALPGGGFTLLPVAGVFRLIAEAAAKSPEEHVFIIDEINRANVSKVFGELITLIEPDKRLGMSEELRLRLPHSDKPFGVPANLHIIGTMNTADRSIALLDTALRRRFVFREIAPRPSLLKSAAERTGLPLVEVLATINDRIEYLVDREHRIGHAFFIDCETRDDADAVMRDKIIPLLQEYFFEDWGRVAAVLGAVDGGSGGFLECRMLKDPTGHGGEDRPSWAVRPTFTEDAYARLAQGPARAAAQPGSAAEPAGG